MATFLHICKQILSEENFISANAKFTINLYRKLPRSLQQNLFFSPTSISVALAMTYLGARGDTAKQMKNAMQFEGIPDQDVHRSFEKIQTAITDQKHKSKLLLANGLFVEKSYRLREEFLAKASIHYQAELAPTDFKLKPDKSRTDINRWVEDKTKNKITDILDLCSVNAMTRLVLVNAIYFKGEWAEKFQKRQTNEEDFFVKADEKVKVLFMSQKGYFRYGYNEKLDSFALELPYIGNDISMFVLLPRGVDGLGQLEAQLSEEHLSDPEGAFQMKRAEVNMKIPQFRLEHSFGLDDTLRSMGMKDLFDEDKADLTGLGGTVVSDLFISRILHTAFIEVNEEGSEAGAATMSRHTYGFPMKIPKYKIFYADHPFLFFIRHNPTKSILFLGRFARRSVVH